MNGGYERARFASSVSRGSSVGSAKRDDIIGLKARCASAAQTRGASVGNRALMNGGARADPAGELLRSWLSWVVCKERHIIGFKRDARAP